MIGKIVHAQENYCQISFREVRITNDISNKTYKSAGYREIKTLQIKMMSKSELKLFIDTIFLRHPVELRAVGEFDLTVLTGRIG